MRFAKFPEEGYGNASLVVRKGVPATRSSSGRKRKSYKDVQFPEEPSNDDAETQKKQMISKLQMELKTVRVQNVMGLRVKVVLIVNIHCSSSCSNFKAKVRTLFSKVVHFSNLSQYCIVYSFGQVQKQIMALVDDKNDKRSKPATSSILDKVVRSKSSSKKNTKEVVKQNQEDSSACQSEVHDNVSQSEVCEGLLVPKETKIEEPKVSDSGDGSVSPENAVIPTNQDPTE